MPRRHAFLPLPLAALLLAAGCATRMPERLDVPTPARVVQPAEPPSPAVADAPAPVPPEPEAAPEVTVRATPAPTAATVQTGLASWYGRAFHGRRTASGELYNRHALSAAHRTLPIPSYARVTNPANGRSVIVRINDRGPFIDGRIIDLSERAAQRLGSAALGVAPMRVEPIDADAAGLHPDDGADEAGPLPLANATPRRAFTRAGRGYWIELAAERHRDAALQLQQRFAERLDVDDGRLHLLLAVFDARVQAGPFERRVDAHRVAQRLRNELRLQPLAVSERR
jgi:rare lipoprotein A